MISTRRIRLYYKLTAGVTCPCPTDPCLICYGTNLIGGYKKGPLVEAEEVHSDFCTSHADMILIKGVPMVSPGDIFMFKGKPRRVRNFMKISGPMPMLRVEHVIISQTEPAFHFPMEEAK